MTTPQERIKTLMTTLDNTSLHGIAALDEAVRACSNFSSTQDWLNNFLKDCQAAKDSGCTAEQMANIVCGLVRNNDTGAISGLDAGSGVEKTAISIVPEDSDASAAVMPALGSTTTIDGLQVTWPTQEELTAVISNGANASSVYFALKGLNTWWIHEAIKLGTSSYGLSFTEPDTTIHAIKVNMMYDRTGDYKNSLAWVSWSYYTDTGVTADMSLNINMRFYNNLKVDDPNGHDTVSGQEYLDRTLAHEFVHALMVSNMNYLSKLPLIFKEGIAELIHGIDDERGYAMSALANDLTMLKSALDLNASIPDEKYYAAGYMALRYLAKKDSIAPFVPNTAAWYDSSNTTLVLRAGNAYLNGSEGTQYLSTVTTIDASGSTSKNILVGNSKNNKIMAGSGTSSLWGGGQSSDTLIGGDGTDCFYFGSQDGSDRIYNFDEQKDTIEFYTDDISSVKAEGSAIILKSGSSSLRIADSARKTINVVYQDGTTYHAWIGKNTANTTVYDTSVNFYQGSATAADTITVSESANIWLDNSTSTTYINIDDLDASASSENVTLAGGTTANCLTGGQGSSSLWGGAGQADDTLIGGSGTDYFYFGSADGNDQIHDFGEQQDIIEFYTNDISSVNVSGSNIILGAGSSSLTITGQAGKTITAAYQNGTTYNAWIGRNTTNVKAYDPSLNYYYGSVDAKDTLTVSGSASIWLNNTTSTFYTNIDDLDATDSFGIDILAGNESSNRITGGQAASSLWGGCGQVSDTLVGGGGTDDFYYGINEGTDYIENGTAADKVILYDAGFSYTSAQLSGTTLTVNSAAGSLVITNWSENGMNTFQLANGDQYKFTQTGTTLTPQKI